MNPWEFQELVGNDVRNQATKEQQAFLRSPDTLNDWYDSLIKLTRNIDLQFAGKRAEITKLRLEITNDPDKKIAVGYEDELTWPEYQVYIADWRVKTIRFKQAIEERIMECRKLRRTTVTKDQVSLNGVEMLIHAIEEHKNRLEEDTQDVDESIDEALWDVLDRGPVNELKRLIGAA